MQLNKNYFKKEEITSDGNKFLLGNGHLGYRGTLEEMASNECVALNIVGLYDKSGDKWRESVNAFNPFFLLHSANNKELSVLKTQPISHSQTLNIRDAFFERTTEFKEAIVYTQRFLSSSDDTIVGGAYTLTANEDIEVSSVLGICSDIFEINGPHFACIEKYVKNNLLCVSGKTNEGNNVLVTIKIHCSKEISFTIDDDEGIFRNYTYSLRKGETISFTIIGRVLVLEDEKDREKLDSVAHLNYQQEASNHVRIFNNKMDRSMVSLKGDDESQGIMNYAIYHIQILGSDSRSTSIPARGVSGQTYKGAIFWDTEIFLLPFFILQNRIVSDNLLEYRINGLKGAKEKAAQYGFKGAYYAWESQDNGVEACSQYNVTDALTGAPIRTYFVDKQIHISMDVVFGFLQHYRHYKDLSIFRNGGLLIFLEVMKFYQSYAVYNASEDLYHLNDVLGPDEYHERVNDNMFTNYLIFFTGGEIHRILEGLDDETIKKAENSAKFTLKEVVHFLERIYLPLPNDAGVFEQFEGYYELEDITPSELKKRLKHPKEYWGGPNGVATHTRVIKQADVVCLLALFPEMFSYEMLKVNYDFYEKYTEHGSSLSKTMYGIVAAKIGYLDEAFKMMMDSASIDLSTNQKEWAGTIYIGGSHPASVGGSYLILTKGFSGLELEGDEVFLDCPGIPKNIEEINYKIRYRGRTRPIQIVNGGYKV